jgi:hypothetical protein
MLLTEREVEKKNLRPPYLDRQAVSLKIDTMVSTQWHPI